MIIEIPNENSIIKWKNNEKDEWKSVEISDLIKAYERLRCGMKTCKNYIYSRKIIPRNTNCPSEFVCSLSDEDFHDCISNDMWHFSSKVLDKSMEDDAKQASIPYTYKCPQHDWKCGYPNIIRGKEE